MTRLVQSLQEKKISLKTKKTEIVILHNILTFLRKQESSKILELYNKWPKTVFV